MTSTDLKRIAGRTLHGSDGRIGKIVDVYESTDGDGPTFATVATGLFGGAASFFPLHQATRDGDTVHVPYPKDFVKDAPRVEADADLTAEEEARLFQYYRPLDMTIEASEASAAPRPDPASPRLRRYVDPEGGAVYPEGSPLRELTGRTDLPQ